MPSYLSSTQTSGPSRVMISVGVLGRRREHELERMEQRELGVVQAAVAGQLGEAADVAGQHAGPLHGVERAIEGLGDGRLDQPLAQADAQLAAEDLDDRPWPWPDRERASRSRRSAALAAGPRGLLDRRERGGHLRQRRRGLRRRRMAGRQEHVLHGPAEVRVAVVGRAKVLARDRRHLTDGRHDRGPAQARRPLVGLGERPAREEDGRDRQLVGREAAQVIGQEGGLLGRPGGRRHALGQVAPAAHGGDGIRFRRCRPERGSRRS